MMTAYGPQYIADVLMMVNVSAQKDNNQASKPGPAQSGQILVVEAGMLSPHFGDLSNPHIIRLAHPRSLMNAERRLEDLGFVHRQTDQMIFPLLQSFERNFTERLRISIPWRKWGEVSDIKRLVIGDYKAFMGASYRFMIYQTDVTKDVEFNHEQLEYMVYDDLLRNLTVLHDKKPALFDVQPKGRWPEYSFD